MPRLILVFAWRTLTLLVLSPDSSYFADLRDELILCILNKNEPGIFLTTVNSLLSKDLLFRTYFSSLRLVLNASCEVALNVYSYYNAVQIIFSGRMHVRLVCGRSRIRSLRPATSFSGDLDMKSFLRSFSP